jgi:hypothetical protein
VILEALRRRDADGAEAAMRQHIRRSVDHLMQEVEAEAQDQVLDPPVAGLPTSAAPQAAETAAPRRRRQRA